METTLQRDDLVVLNGSVDTAKFKRRNGSVKYTEDCVARYFAKVGKRIPSYKTNRNSDTE